MSMLNIGPSFYWNIVLSLGHSVWLGVVIVSLAASGNYLLRDKSANTRYWLNLVGLASFTICLPIAYLYCGMQSNGNLIANVAGVESSSPPSASTTMDGVNVPTAVSDPKDVFQQTGISSPPDTIDQSPASPPAKFPAWAIRVIAVGYLVGVCYMLIRLALAVRRSQALFESSTPISDATLLAKAARVSDSLSLRIRPVIAVSEKIAVPVAVGLLRPAVLLPASIISGLSVSEIELVLRHELAHLRRHDHFVIVLQRLMESLLFYHPATWYLSRRINEERENCCDDLACVGNVNRLDYASVLIRVAEIAYVAKGSNSNDSIALAADGHRPSKLRQRISRLLIPATATPTTGPKAVLCLLIVISMSAALLAGNAVVARISGQPQEEMSEGQDDDAKADLIDLVDRSHASVKFLRTGDVKFKFIRVPIDFDISHAECVALIEEIGPIDSEAKLNQLIQLMADGKPVDKLSFVDAELHFDPERTRESISSADGNSVHITDSEFSMRWDPANYQMDISPIKKNRIFQLTKGHFLQPMLPPKTSPRYADYIKNLKSYTFTRVGQDVLVESSDAAGGLLIHGRSGFPIYRDSGRPNGSLIYRGGWKRYPKGVWFPDVSFELRFRNDKVSHISAEVVQSAKFNVDLPDHLFVMSAPAGTDIIWEGKFRRTIREDVFDVLSEVEIKEATRRLEKRELTQEEKRGVKVAKELYSLKAGEVFKRIAPPYPLARKYITQMLGGLPDGRRPEDTMSWIFNFREDGTFERKHLFSGGTYRVRDIAKQIFELQPSAIEGDDELLNRRLPGDFVVRVGADSTEVADALRRVIERELQVEVEVKFDMVSRPVYVANGTLKLELDAEDKIKVHSGSKPGLFPEIISNGNLERFLSSLSKYVNRNIKLGDVLNADQKFKWSEAAYLNDQKPKDKQFPFDVAKVLEIVEAQTGLMFEKQKEERNVLTIRKKDD